MTSKRPASRDKKPPRASSKRPARPAPTLPPPKRGQRCPQCRKAKLDYDSFLNLVCTACGYSGVGGGCT
jgi:uncharacterized protein (DUF983 family)